jgi:hypothetical protein
MDRMIAMPLLAVRLIDLAIFGSLGALWIGGATFIVLLYRWILRFERGEGPTTEAGIPVLAEPQPAPRERVPPRVAIPQAATAREGYAPDALASHS